MIQRRPYNHLPFLCGLVVGLAVAAHCSGRCGAQGITTDFAEMPQPSSVDFASEVVPALTQAGCNSGACHGAAAGRGYLKLSLFGSRPVEDYETLLFAVPGRFVDLQQPGSSLMLQKPGGYLEHGGGVRIDSRGAAYRLLANWIDQGAQRGSLAGIAKLSIQPNSVMDGLIGQPLRIQVAAEATDGTPRSIHRWLSLTDAQPVGTPNATVEYRLLDDALELTPQLAGYWPVTLRAGAQAVTVQLFVKADSDRGTTSPAQTFGGTFKGASTATSYGTAAATSGGANALPAADDAGKSIDALVGQAQQRLGLSPAERCPPPLLARRLWLDLAGRHPSSSEWQSAIDDLEQGEIERLVDRLLESDEFAVRAGEVLANWGAAHSFTKQPSAPLANAIGDELLVSDNLQHLVRKMLLVPSSSVDPLTVFHRFAGDPRGRAELIAATWLGVRVGCAQCHDHPLDHWTQDDYFAMAACWAEIETGADAEQTVRRLAGRTTTDLRSGREAVPRLPGDLRPLSGRTTADEAWVAWLTDEANPQFSRNLANRTWAWLLGSGLVMAVDDHRATNPAVHAALLDHLAESLVESNFSLRSLVRTIVLSDCYARATEFPENNSLAMDSPSIVTTASRLHQLMWSVRVPKPIDRPLPQLASDALGSIGDAVTDQPPESNAMESPTAGCSRGQACRDPFSESLELVAGEELNAFIAAVVRRNGNAAKQSPLELLDDFHFKLFGRPLNESERERYRTQWLEPLAPLPSAADVVEDIVWSWLVSPAFRQQY